MIVGQLKRQQRELLNASFKGHGGCAQLAHLGYTYIRFGNGHSLVGASSGPNLEGHQDFWKRGKRVAAGSLFARRWVAIM